MSETMTLFECANCGAQYSKWSGRCEECGKWNTIAKGEAVAEPSAASSAGAVSVVLEKNIRSYSLADRAIVPGVRLTSGIPEFDRVLGGGFVMGGVVVLAGNPGIGKSTLVLQLCGRLAAPSGAAAASGGILYVSGEESVEQIALRAQRLGISSAAVNVLNETRVEAIEQVVTKEKPSFLIIDSIQTTHVAALAHASGSLAQVRATTDRLIALAKSRAIPTLIVSHVTKEGLVAGPKTLEHMVDAVVYLEGDRYQQFRLLRATKNRFGSTNETGLFEMKREGLVEVKNPSKIFLSHRPVGETGTVVSATVEGSRALLIEVQALANTTTFGYAKRTAHGVSLKRLELLLAVLSKRAGLQLGNQDVYANIAGGFDVKDRGIDLALCLAVASSERDRPVGQSVAAIGEVGLLGEIRPVSELEKRVKEAAALGFTTIYIPPQAKAASSGGAGKKSVVTLVPVATIKEALKHAGLL